MIRTLVAYGRTLVRGALAFVLGAEADIEVVAEIGQYDELPAAVATHRPDVTVVDLDLVVPVGVVGLRWLRQGLAGSGLLVLAEARRSQMLGPLLAAPEPGVGFLAKEASPARFVAAVRSVYRRESVVDPDLAVAAVRGQTPLTPRETEVLGVAAEGVPIEEIATRLGLSIGTVRNHLSRVIGKVGARTRIEAVRIAHEAGWI